MTRLQCDHLLFTPCLETTPHLLFPTWHQQHTGDKPRAGKTMWQGTNVPADEQRGEKWWRSRWGGQDQWAGWGSNNMRVNLSSQCRGTFPGKCTQHSPSTAFSGPVFNYSAIKSPVTFFSDFFFCDWKYFTAILHFNPSPGCLYTTHCTASVRKTQDSWTPCG